ncbi:hypothetical protein [Mobiluncus mulieris]|uniref:hypothetical protein n=1 Tax=Mobiluncus mulieris TaxID=2052 RepID=UPI0014704A24|nr:hypothetical protein [Mobiluncus mulieris]NMX10627.1 hypothetical protein [Mobiluncus mulieris]
MRRQPRSFLGKQSRAPSARTAADREAARRVCGTSAGLLWRVDEVHISPQSQGGGVKNQSSGLI